MISQIIFNQRQDLYKNQSQKTKIGCLVPTSFLV